MQTSPRSIRGTLETKFGAVWVHGEVSNYKLHPSGHQYFTLKDARAQIACAIFRDPAGAGAPLQKPLVDERRSKFTAAYPRIRAAHRFSCLALV